MKLQYDLMQMNLEQELTSKTADKTTQGVQTLFKNQ
jgi:type III secretion system YscI/HrpB-like protein